MRFVVFVGLIGCGFAPSPGRSNHDVDATGSGSADARLVDAHLIDAPPDAMKTWQQVEMLTVACSGQSVMSTTVLLATGMYRLRATSECVTNDQNDSHGDAEYFGYNVNLFGDGQAGVDNGISIDNTTPGPTKVPNWGTYTATHGYEVPWTGLNAPITANYWDSNYSNNTGSLMLAILSYQ